MRKVLAIFGLLVAVAAGGLLPAGTAYAASGCGSHCDQQDPNTFDACGYGSVSCPDGVVFHCADDARTVSSTSYVQLRYSPSCRTVWARYVNEANCPCTVAYVQSFYSSGSLRTTAYDGTTAGPWSLMLNDAGLLGRACVTYYDAIVDGPVGPAHTSCTSKY